MNYSRYYSTKRTPQTQAIPGKNQVKNNAGGYSFAISNWERLDRFLVLGSEGGTYYVGEQKLTIDNAKNVRACIDEDGFRTVGRIVEISQSGRAPKNDPALFALALCVAFGNESTRAEALASLHKVARIGTHLFQFVHFVDSMASWNRSLRRAISNWYNEKAPEKVAYQVLKYQSRRVEQGVASSAWSHRDVLRMAHPRPATGLHSKVFNWAINGWDTPEEHPELELAQIWAYEMAKGYDNEKDIISLINDYHLTREMVPTKWLNSPAVWEALLVRMPMTALVRNLGKMTNVGLISRLSNAERIVGRKLRNESYLKKGRIHPLKVLVAMKTYAQGHGMRGKLTWNPVGQVTDALNDAFYLSFGNVTPTGRRICLALDVSGSMGSEIAGTPLSCAEATAAMAMVNARVEPNYYITAFCHKLVSLPVTPRQRLDDVMRMTYNSNWGGTDCSLPMTEAIKGRIPVEAFVIYTDSETYFSPYIHPSQALEEFRKKEKVLRRYRDTTGIDAKLVVVGMTATEMTIADPHDANSLDVVGFDTATPQLISNFIAD